MFDDRFEMPAKGKSGACNEVQMAGNSFELSEVVK
jgi:hypothetical protein